MPRKIFAGLPLGNLLHHRLSFFFSVHAASDGLVEAVDRGIGAGGNKTTTDLGPCSSGLVKHWEFRRATKEFLAARPSRLDDHPFDIAGAAGRRDDVEQTEAFSALIVFRVVEFGHHHDSRIARCGSGCGEDITVIAILHLPVAKH